jgi:FMN reductase
MRNIKNQSTRTIVLGLSGSLREFSSSQFALEHAMTALQNVGCRTRIFDIRRTSLPFCNGDPERQSQTEPGVKQLRDAVAQAHCLVLVTPEYHAGMSGVLKNALDLLDKKQLQGKVVGVISVLGGDHSSGALNDLSCVMRSCHAWVSPVHIAITRASSRFVNGQLSDQELRLRFDEFANTLADSTVRICGLNRGEIDLCNSFANSLEGSSSPAITRLVSCNQRGGIL